MLLAHARRAAVVSTRMAGTIRGTSICRTYSKDTGGNVSNQPVIELGGLTHKIISPKNPLLVPTKYLGDELPQNLLKHMRWMLQKDKLGQDMFLIGAPGSQRRRLVMAFCEMTQREVEYVSLSRDTTESDLKQRREIKAATAYYVDQAAVRAAKEGK
ncbi:hypothetical protein SARC_12740 [Sphaeroforma arctica JP610]|uniref:ATPase dynein-related AAA domain-containing protein n=1 Tax=Sphaeroforma arctica JP610 TaxID=667725 RepID=A0A0L0FF94_9EUKA|nr:hypothetical protein SARC_12740 [Sphaeroforma arctica JP610]KNC74718.1 hypothetical protein SARC_12740 [Sphaeroforma arctica JP610]|eukprot:XP_014148620.1 hypothetical protein SARC_12740 [Sphaeroforma arctica JP610]